MVTVSKFCKVVCNWVLMPFTEIQEKFSLLKSEASPSPLPLDANICSIFAYLRSYIPVCPLNFQVLCFFSPQNRSQ